MVTEYEYTRTLQSDGNYDIENHDRVDGESKQIHLAKEIETALPGKTFRVCCNGTSCKACFDVALSGADETTLNGVVSDHINNV